MKKKEKNESESEGVYLCMECYQIEKQENALFSKAEMQAFQVCMGLPLKNILKKISFPYT